MKFTINWLEQKKTPTGKDVKNATLIDELGVVFEKVSIWGDFPDWVNLSPGRTVSGNIKANAKGYKSLSPEMTTGFNRGPSGAVKAAEVTSASVVKAQDRKEKGIAYFNAVNSAISLVTSSDLYKNDDAGDLRTSISVWRDWFLSEWEKYDAQDIQDRKKPF